MTKYLIMHYTRHAESRHVFLTCASPLDSAKLLTASALNALTLLLLLAALDESISCDRSLCVPFVWLFCVLAQIGVVIAALPFCALLMGLNRCISDFGESDVLEKGGFAHLGGGGGGVVFVACVGECCVFAVGNVCGCVI